MVNYIEGDVRLDGQPAKVKIDKFPQMRPGSELSTKEGRAEVLLGPGVFMRVGENSAVKMVSDDIMASRLDFLSGSVIVESADLAKDEQVTLTYKGSSIDLSKKGVYRLDSEPPQISVYDGEAKVTNDGQVQTVKRSRQLRLEGIAVAEKFDNKTGDALFRWARRRAEYLAVANVSVARDASRYGYWGSNNWIWNPFFGTFTFLPMDGFYDSFWGYRFWSPASVYMFYVPRWNYGYPGYAGYSGSRGAANSAPPSSASVVTRSGSGATSSAMSGRMSGGGGGGGGRMSAPASVGSRGGGVGGGVTGRSH